MSEFVVTRVFDAPLDVVYSVYTDVEHLRNWWGPKGFSMVHCTLDLRPGGVFLYGMSSAGGQEMWGKWVFRRIEPGVLLEFSVSFSNASGGTVRAPFNEHWPLEVLSTVEFQDLGGRTLVTMRSEPVDAGAEERAAFDAFHESMRQGWSGTLDKLDAYLSSIRPSSAA